METVYLGHRAGEILVPPVAVLDQLLVIRSPSDDYSEIQVLASDAKTKRVTSFGKPQRLKGRVVTPLAVSFAASSCCCVALNPADTRCHRISHSTWHCTSLGNARSAASKGTRAG